MQNTIVMLHLKRLTRSFSRWTCEIKDLKSQWSSCIVWLSQVLFLYDQRDILELWLWGEINVHKSFFHYVIVDHFSFILLQIHFCTSAKGFLFFFLKGRVSTVHPFVPLLPGDNDWGEQWLFLFWFCESWPCFLRAVIRLLSMGAWMALWKWDLLKQSTCWHSFLEPKHSLVRVGFIVTSFSDLTLNGFLQAISKSQKNV